MRLYKGLATELIVAVVTIALLVAILPLGVGCGFFTEESLPASSEEGLPAPEANFIANPTTGSAPLFVQFTDQSIGSITACSWDFDNDGIVDSSEQNPSYIYNDPGVYTVSLKVTGANGSFTLRKIDYIRVTSSNTKNVYVAGAVVVGGDGHRITLVNNPNATNPTYDQLLLFLKMDITEKHPYVLGSYVCSDFAETLHNNAEKAGIGAAYVSVNCRHGLNAFMTTDRGLIYVDDAGLDTIAHVVVGDEYALDLIWPDDRKRLAGVSVDVGIVKSVQVDW